MVKYHIPLTEGFPKMLIFLSSSLFEKLINYLLIIIINV